MERLTAPAKPPHAPSASPPASQARSTDHLAWIAGRIETLLAHFYQPDLPPEVQEAAIEDWVRMLSGQSRDAIDNACFTYLRDQGHKRPTPAEIRNRAKAWDDTRNPYPNAKPDDRPDPRIGLSHDETALLETKVLPTARRWVESGSTLATHGAKTLAFWGEPITVATAIRLRLNHGLVISPDHTANPAAFRSWLRELSETGKVPPEPAYSRL